MSARHWSAALGIATGLTLVFWWPLWQGGGLIGGDTYTYYLPQKAYYADRLHAGEFPLWNSLVGHGYPLVAESQTGACYPPNVLLYWLFDVNAAYSISHLLHYAAAFTAVWLLALRLGRSAWGAAFAGIVFVYGWFPPRVCLEWAIIGGVYFPLVLYLVESFLQTKRRGYLLGASAAIGLHLLAGHYNLCFITLLTTAAYAVLRLFWTPRGSAPALTNGKYRSLAAIGLALAAGFFVAAVQVLPTWELKQHSQRVDVGRNFDPAYGHIPPWYLSQVVAPWLWYTPDVDIDQALATIKTLSIPAATNKVEAHLYFGQLPVLLVVYGGLGWWWSRRPVDPFVRIWGLLGVAATVYATGWPVYLLGRAGLQLPGFSFFMGPGRYGIVPALGMALVSAQVLERWRARRPTSVRTLVFLGVCCLTIADLWLVSRWVTYAVMVGHPPIQGRGQSEVRQLLLRAGGLARMSAPGPNLSTLTGIAATPPYLGLSPAEYFDPTLTMPARDAPIADLTSGEIEEQVGWMRRTGVTHLLRQTPLDTGVWPVAPVWRGFDRLLNPAWARYQEPLYLYALADGRGRVALLNGRAEDRAEIVDYRANRVTLSVDTSSGGTVVLTDLQYPGWEVTVDGVSAPAQTVEGMFRGVAVAAGRHDVVWHFAPRSVFWGGMVSGLSVLVLLGFAAAGRFASRR